MDGSVLEKGKAETGRIGLREVFRRNPMFSMVWAGAFASNIGNWMENSAQNWAVVSALKNDPVRSTSLSAILNLADFAPALFLALAGGLIADRVNLRKYLLLLQALACVLGAGLAWAATAGYASPWVVIWFTFAEGIVWALNGPAWQTLVPHLVPRRELPVAIAANSAQFNLARLVGPFLAGLIIVRFDIAGAFWINALSFAPVLYVLWRLPANADKRKTKAKRGPLMKDLGSGIVFVFKHAGLRRLAIMLACFTMFAAPAQSLLAAYVQQVMKGDSRLYGVMLGGIGLGALIGALTISQIPEYYPRHHLIPLAMALGSCFILMFTLFATPWICFALLVGVGYFWMLSVNSSNAAAQLLAGDENRGRIMSVILLCIQGFPPLGLLMASGLAYVMGPAWIMRGMVGVLLMVALFFLVKREPAIDGQVKRGNKLTFMEGLWEAVTAQSHKPVPVRVQRELAREGATIPDVPHNSGGN